MRDVLLRHCLKTELLTTTESRLKRWTWKRWLFLLLVSASIVFLVIVVFRFLQQAQTSFAVDTFEAKKIQGLLINQQRYDAAVNTTPTWRQVHVLLRVAEDYSWQKQHNRSARSQRFAIAKILNEHDMSLAEFEWIQQTALPIILSNDKQENALRVFQKRFASIQHFSATTSVRSL
jgi:hypothetical protein